MAKVKMGFKGLPVADQIERARMIKGKMTGNIHYVSPNPSLASYGNAVNALEKAYNESRNRDTVKMEIMRLRRNELLIKTSLLAGYVQSASGGNTEIILSSGFDLALPGNAIPAVTMVFNVRLRKATADGSLRVRWNKVPGAKVYLVRVMLDPEEPGNAEIKAAPSASFCTIKGLIPDRRYYVQVAAVGGGKVGEWSNPVGKYVE
jgi:hypothetical protein